jgi:hypothetical protein
MSVYYFDTNAFVSADVEQLQAAQVEGLVVENPDNYT